MVAVPNETQLLTRRFVSVRSCLINLQFGESDAPCSNDVTNKSVTYQKLAKLTTEALTRKPASPGIKMVMKSHTNMRHSASVVNITRLPVIDNVLSLLIIFITY